MRKVIAVVLVLLVSGIVDVGDPSRALADVTCLRKDPLTGVCDIAVNSGGRPGGTHKGDTRSAGDQRASGGSKRTCSETDVLAQTSRKLSCSYKGMPWSNENQCYARLMSPQPPKSDPRWNGHTSGAMYTCVRSNGSTMAIAGFWSATGPAAPPPPPDPRVLAQQALKAMQLKAIKIGIVPEPRLGSVGIIGLPTWMWVADPGPSTTGPITRSASAAGYTVTATGKLDRVVWRMGDGATVSCLGRGTPYKDSYGRQSSPTCGHTYTKSGRYTVQATSYWTVNWEGIGQTGEIPLDFTADTAITMGESQVVVTG